MSALFLRPRSIETWRKLAATSHQARYARLLDQAQSYADYLPPAEHPSDSITYIGMAVANLGLAYVLSQEPHYLEIARRWINVALGYPSWGKERMPDHDLDAAWLLFGLSLGYDWLKDDLPLEERHALRDKLHHQGICLFEFAVETEGQWWSSAYWQNHNWICYVGLATTAYALKHEYPETKQWSDRALANFQTVLPLMPDDGSDYEGPLYWRYGFIWFLIYADLVQQEEAIDLHDSDFLRGAGDFRLYLSAPNLINTANFGDCHDRRSSHSAAINHRLASLYDLGHIQAFTDEFHSNGEWLREGREGLVKPGVLPEAVLEFLWYNPNVAHQPLDTRSLVQAYPDMGLVSSRTSWHADATFLAFKCGSPTGHKAWSAGQAYNRLRDWQTISAGHAHPDENGFILVQGEDYLVVDEGYSRAKSSKHHSTILVDGQGQYHEGGYNAFRELGPEWGGRLEGSFNLGSSSYMRGEAARAYHPDLGLRQFTRQVLFLDGDLVVIYDTLRANHNRRFDWQLQLDEAPQVVDDQTFSVHAGKSTMHVHIAQPADFQYTQHEEEITANPTSAKPDWIIRRMQYALTIAPPEPTQATSFLVALNLAEFAVTSVNAKRGHVLQASRDNTHILTAFADQCDGIWSADIETDASWLSYTLTDDKIQKLLVGEATNLWIKQQLWLSADVPIQVAYGLDDSDVNRSKADSSDVDSSNTDGSDTGTAHYHWKIQTTSATFVSLRLPQRPAHIHLNGSPVQAHYNDDLSLLRLAIPAGESEVICHV
ncbi:MAG: heparinase II/III family protein [Deinococcota bacterium]